MRTGIRASLPTGAMAAATVLALLAAAATVLFTGSQSAAARRGACNAYKQPVAETRALNRESAEAAKRGGFGRKNKVLLRRAYLAFQDGNERCARRFIDRIPDDKLEKMPLSVDLDRSKLARVGKRGNPNVVASGTAHVRAAVLGIDTGADLMSMSMSQRGWYNGDRVVKVSEPFVVPTVTTFGQILSWRNLGQYAKRDHYREWGGNMRGAHSSVRAYHFQQSVPLPTGGSIPVRDVGLGVGLGFTALGDTVVITYPPNAPEFSGGGGGGSWKSAGG